MTKSLRALGVALAAASMLILAGCAGDGGDNTAAPAEPAAELSSEAQAALEIVEAASVSVDEFEAPGDAIDGSAIAGKTVYYIPATLQVPVLKVIGENLTDALDNLDATVQVCDGKANPADIASCVAQAIAADAGAVVTAGITPEFAPAAFADLTAAGIPWVQGLTAPAGAADPTQVAYVTENQVLLQSWSTNWVIADSDAKANVLVIKLTDTPATTMWADAGILATYEKGCADCVVEVIEINSGQLDRLQSLISSTLVAKPDITYIQAQFDQFLPAVAQGIQSAARDDITVASVDGFLSTLQDMEAGGNIKSAVAYNKSALGWYLADAAARLAAGQPAVQNLDFPFRRAFNETNLGDLTLTPEAEASGEWFGDADYQAGFLELWGTN
ncbi:substrate-binding domain-containing protein [Salinibacterium sp. ZJ450]|uniref:sugar ABC transporter substrate-binding protein n=1 Tax=Salinibacterium sp. ZJ450 TaxID=2708338 RepID=UPI001421F89C|nr:substrate-binding domain-containing protein [Salinibacterium sp. ZJ450]